MPLSLWSIGLAVVLYAAYRVAWWIYTSFFKPVDLSKYRRGQSWAVVTGATDGIGLGYATLLAEHGLNVLLVGRNREKLEGVRKTLQAGSKGIQVDYVVSNATDLGAANFAAVVDKVGSRDVSILINNVGIGQNGLKPVHELAAEDIAAAVNVNCIYPSLLTRALMPVLLRHKGPKLVVNVSSVAALFMAPFSAIYAATKAYNRQFSLAMSGEYCGEGVDVLCVEPGFVASNMTKMQPSLVCCTPRECVEQSLRKIGEIETIPHWKHVLMMTLVKTQSLVPTLWAPAAANYLISWGRASARNISEAKTE